MSDTSWSRTRAAEVLHDEDSLRLLEYIDQDLGITAASLERQTLNELHHTLKRTNDAIDDAQGYLDGVLKRQDKDWNNINFGRFRKLLGNRLLTRKLRVLEQISLRAQQLDSEEIKEVVEEASGAPETTERTVKALSVHFNQRLQEDRVIQTEIYQTEEERRKTMLLQADLRDRKSALARAWFERESVASIVGAILLLGLATVLVVAMFRGTTPTEVITSAFLLILGYFFGQATSKSKSDGSSSGSE